jgi:hypothetical protein
MLEIKNPASTLMGKVVAIRTSGGEEIVGKLTAESDTLVTIAKPIIVHLQMMQQGGAAISFAPFSLARDDGGEFTFYRSNLLTVPAEARDDIRANYIKATTGLDIPTSGGASSILKA